MSKKKAPYTFPHRSRKARVDYITGIGGYGSRDGLYPIEFTVGTYYADGSKEHLLERIAAGDSDSAYATHDDPSVRDKYMGLAAREYDRLSDELFNWALEDARSSLTDCDTYRMLYDADKTLDVTLGLHGRGGKHLVIEEFEGFQFKGLTEEDLYNGLMSQENENTGEVIVADKLKRAHKWVTSDKWVETFYRYVRQCEIDFTSTAASREVEYQMLWHLASCADDQYAALFATTPTTGPEEVRAALHRLLRARPGAVEDIATLCTALSIPVSEILPIEE